MTDKLSNLHLLLRADSFCRWPLEVRFYCEDVYKVWQRWAERVDGKIPDSIHVILDKGQRSQRDEPEDASVLPASNQALAGHSAVAVRGGINDLDVTYAGIKAHVEKSKALLLEDQTLTCSLCKERVNKEAELMTTCLQPECSSVSHLTCLSAHYIGSAAPGDMIVPLHGICPSCRTSAKWIDVVKDLSLRTFGHVELAKLLKKPREKKAKPQKPRKGRDGALRADSDVETNLEDHADESTSDFSDQEFADAEVTTGAPNGWASCAPLADDDVVSVTSLTSLDPDFMHLSPRKPIRDKRNNLRAVIEDSDWDDAEVLD